MTGKRNAPKLALRGAGIIKKRNVILSRLALYAPLSQALPETLFMALVLTLAGSTT
jgi:hypothetical protein